jgi:hypothetical protein
MRRIEHAMPLDAEGVVDGVPSAARDRQDGSAPAPCSTLIVRKIPFGVSDRPGGTTARTKRRAPVLPEVLAPPLSEKKVPEIVKRFSGFARACIHRAIACAPVRRFAARASTVADIVGGIRTADAAEVRRGLHASVDDLLQDLWLAFVVAVRRERVRAADAAIRGWIATTARFISHGTMGGAPFVLACVGAPARLGEHDDEPRPALRRAGATPEQEFPLDRVARIAAIRAREPKILEEVQWEVIERRLRGDDYDVIASDLGLNRDTARCHCHRGVARLRAALLREDALEATDEGGEAA